MQRRTTLPAFIRNTMAAGCLSLAAAAPQAAQADILFDGEYTNFGSFLDSKGWENGTNVLLTPWSAPIYGASTGLWSNQVAFYGVTNTWLYNQSQDVSRITVVQDPTNPSHRPVGQFIVQPGDNLGHPGAGERAELSIMLDGVGHREAPITDGSGHEFYAFAVKLSPDWQSPGADPKTGATWGIIAQFHGPDAFGAPPALAIAVDGGAFHLNYDAGDLSEGGTITGNKNGVSYPFSNGALRPGHWVEFTLSVRWTTKQNGFVEIYRRDDGKGPWAHVLALQGVPTLQWKTGASDYGTTHYWKTGFYRSPTPDVTNLLWLTPMVRGTTMKEVRTAAFGTN